MPRRSIVRTTGAGFPTRYKVSGELNPDATGVYSLEGTYGGKPYYHRRLSGASEWYLWWYTSDLQWTISTALGGFGGIWYKAGIPIPGEYPPFGGGYTGTATVTAVKDS